MELFPINESYVFRLRVRTTKAVIINGVLFCRSNSGAAYNIPFYFSSADAGTALITGAVNTKLIAGITARSWLQSVALVMLTAGVQTGECFITVDILPDANSTIPIKQLIGEYLTSSTSISYPENPIVDSLSGVGAIKSQSFSHGLVADLATYNLTVPANLIYKVESAFLLHNLDATGSQSVLTHTVILDAGLLHGFKLLSGFQDSVKLGATFYPGAAHVVTNDADEQWLSSSIADIKLASGTVFTLSQNKVSALESERISFRQWIAP